MKHIIALVGMPGAGKSEASLFLQRQGVPFVRFGDLTDAAVAEMGLPLTPENERKAREKLRKDFGMGIYATRAEPKIRALLEKHSIIGLDGLYSWEEYLYLIKLFPQLILMHLFARPQVRYERLSKRANRQLNIEQGRQRDIAEIDALHKSGPIAIADYLIKNESNLEDFHTELKKYLKEIQAK